MHFYPGFAVSCVIREVLLYLINCSFLEFYSVVLYPLTILSPINHHFKGGLLVSASDIYFLFHCFDRQLIISKLMQLD